MLLRQQVQRSCASHCLRTAMDIEFAIDVVEMRFDGADGDDELLGDCLIGHASGKTL